MQNITPQYFLAQYSRLSDPKSSARGQANQHLNSLLNNPALWSIAQEMMLQSHNQQQQLLSTQLIYLKLSKSIPSMQLEQLLQIRHFLFENIGNQSLKVAAIGKLAASMALIVVTLYPNSWPNLIQQLTQFMQISFFNFTSGLQILQRIPQQLQKDTLDRKSRQRALHAFSTQSHLIVHIFQAALELDHHTVNLKLINILQQWAKINFPLLQYHALIRLVLQFVIDREVRETHLIRIGTLPIIKSALFQAIDQSPNIEYISLFVQIQLTTMIGGARRTNDFDSFITLNQPSKLHSPRNLPLQPANNYHSNALPDKPERHHSPNRIANTRKPMISPARSPRNPLPRKNKPESERPPEYVCANENHAPKKAEFVIRIEEEDMFYCGVCAAQAASQGFAVNRIPIKKQRVVPQYPQYQNNKRYHQVTELLKGILGLQNEYKKVEGKRAKQHYERQTELLNGFYDDLQGIVQKMRGDHLADLSAQCEKNCHSQALGQQNLRLHLQELGQFWEDIQPNIQQVVEMIDAANYSSCMNTYRNSLQVFSHKLEQFEEETQKYTAYHPSALDKKIKLFEQQLVELWEDTNHTDYQRTVKIIPESKRHQTHPTHPAQQPTTIRNVHEMLPKSANHKNNDGQDPFRNLFPDQEPEERLPEASPQFKAF